MRGAKLGDLDASFFTKIDEKYEMDRKRLEELANNPKHIPGIYNYCDRWCERCQFTSRCLNCTLAEEQFGDLEKNDEINEVFWQGLSEMLQDTIALIKEMAEEAGVDLDSIESESHGNDEAEIRENALAHLIAHTSHNYAKMVDKWFDSNEHLFLEKEDELNQIRLLSSRENPTAEAINMNDAIEVIRWYQFQIHVKLRRAIQSSSREESWEFDEFPKDSDGSAKVALIGIDRSMSAWKILLSSFPEQKDEILNLIALLDNTKNRVETQFPQARGFVRPGFDENMEIGSQSPEPTC